MTRFNDFEELQYNPQLYTTWGKMIEPAVFEDNMSAEIVPWLSSQSARASLRQDGEKFGLLWEYKMIKTKAVHTLQCGFPGPKAQAKGAEGFISKVSHGSYMCGFSTDPYQGKWDAALQRLLEIRHMLKKKGIALDYENLYEDLMALPFNIDTALPKDEANADRRLGQENPADPKQNEKFLHNAHNVLKASLDENTPSKSGSKFSPLTQGHNRTPSGGEQSNEEGENNAEYIGSLIIHVYDTG